MPVQDEVVYTKNSLISSGEMVLMQTAKTDIKNPESDIKQETRILLDSGSQRTYITECLWNEFSLADNLPSKGEISSIDLLIGNDYYLDMILPQK